MRIDMEMTEELLNKFLIDVYHRMVVHHTLWFDEVEKELGTAKALQASEILRKAFHGIQMNSCFIFRCGEFGCMLLWFWCRLLCKVAFSRVIVGMIYGLSHFAVVINFNEGIVYDGGYYFENKRFVFVSCKKNS